MKFCRYCGAELKQGAHFCTKCGKAIKRNPTNDGLTPTQPSSNDSKPEIPSKPANDGLPPQQLSPDVSKPEAIQPDKSSTDSPIEISDIFAFLKRTQTILWCHVVLSVGYTVYQIFDLINSANQHRSVFEQIGRAIVASATVTPHLILLSIAAIFSVVGLWMKRPWAYLTSAIIQTVAAVLLLGLLFMSPALLISEAAMIFLGFTAYNRLKKQSEEKAE